MAKTLQIDEEVLKELVSRAVFAGYNSTGSSTNREYDHRDMDTIADNLEEIAKELLTTKGYLNIKEVG